METLLQAAVTAPTWSIRSCLNWSAIWLIISLISICVVTIGVYRVTIHPLSLYPGPKLWAMTGVVQTSWVFRGRLTQRVADLHDVYGSVVRIGPNELSYISAAAYKDIHGRFPHRAQLRRSPDFLPTKVANGKQGLFFVEGDADHARIRRNFSHGFSDNVLREQEVVVGHYFDLLVEKLRGEHSNPVNVVKWYEITTFDIVADLTFGESFHCLENSKLHAWIDSAFYIVRALFILGYLRRLCRLDKLALLVLSQKTMPLKRNEHRTLLFDKVNRRLSMEKTRSDFMTYIVRNLGTPHGITYGEMVMTASNLLMAGAETTATLLSGLTYYLLKNPTKLEKLVAEIRSTFQSDADITMTSVRQLKYELSAIEEALRLFPPVPTILPRVTPESGCMIAGQFVPEGTTVSMNLFAAFHSKTNFRDPDQFVPERWSGDPMYKSDNLDIVKPFSLGPRTCIGKHLAYAEIKVILAKLLWNFDLHLCEESERWIERLRVFGVWEKVPLIVRFDPVVINS